MDTSKEKYYITTAIAYTSRKPHIGNSYEIVFTDAVARLKRMQGKDVWFLTGTDEETLTKQALRLSERTADRKKSHVVPGEGKTPSSNSGDEGMREFARGLFKRTE